MIRSKTVRAAGLLFFLVLCCLRTAVHAQAIAYLESKDKNQIPGSSLLVTPDGKYLIKTLYEKGYTFQNLIVSVMDLQSCRLVRSMYLRGNGVPPKLTSNGKYLIFATDADGSRVYRYIDYITGNQVWEVPSGNQNIWASDILADSMFLFTDHRVYKGNRRITPDYIDFTAAADGKYLAKFIGRGDRFLTINGGRVFLWALTSNAPLDSYDCGPNLEKIKVAPNGRFFAVSAKGKKSSSFYLTVENDKLKLVSEFSSSFTDIYFGLDYVFMVDKTNLKKFRTRDGELLMDMQFKDYIKGFGGIVESEYTPALDLVLVDKLPGTEYLLVTDMQNLTHFFSTRTNKVTAYYYTLGEKDYAFVTPDGRMEGSIPAIENLQWIGGYLNVSLSNTLDQMFTPDLMKQFLGNTLAANTVNLDNLVRFSPGIKIISPLSNSSTGNSNIAVNCELIDNGDGVDKVRIYVNDKLVSDDTRGMKASGVQISYTVPLIPGTNSVKAVAISKNGYQSSPAEIRVNYNGATAQARLFVIAIGIDNYKNPAYNLNYAVADASAIAREISRSGKTIFKSTRIFAYYNESGRKDSILSGFRKIAAEATPQDAFVLFYAGHGVMNEGKTDATRDFYLALQDVTQMYGKDEMLQAKGISATELREASKLIQAQKQVIFLDACQSGAAVETFAMRGAAEEKAILQLARSTGSFMIASTGSDQFATEFKELGHGVFTYALLQGLSCKSPAMQSAGKVTIKELETYLNDYIPELTQKYHGSVQYPKSWSKGMDFPIGVCGK
jgi:hypothetical protein